MNSCILSNFFPLENKTTTAQDILLVGRQGATATKRKRAESVSDGKKGKKKKKKGKKKSVESAAAAAAAALTAAETASLDEHSSDAAALARQQKVRCYIHTCSY